VVRHGESSAAELENMLCLLQKLTMAQKNGDALSLRKLQSCGADSESLLVALKSHHMVERNERGHWLLARSPEELTLFQLYKVSGHRLPLPGEKAWPQDSVLAGLYSQVGASLTDMLNLSLQDMHKDRVEEMAGTDVNVSNVSERE
jgi:hypothetical protein